MSTFRVRDWIAGALLGVVAMIVASALGARALPFSMVETKPADAAACQSVKILGEVMVGGPCTPVENTRWRAVVADAVLFAAAGAALVAVARAVVRKKSSSSLPGASAG